MLPDPPLDDVGDVLEGRGEVLESVVAEGGVVGEVGGVAKHLLGRSELGQGLEVPGNDHDHGRDGHGSHPGGDGEDNDGYR